MTVGLKGEVPRLVFAVQVLWLFLVCIATRTYLGMIEEMVSLVSFGDLCLLRYAMARHLEGNIDLIGYDKCILWIP